MPGLLTYWHTLRHLRPVQLYGRVLFHIANPRIDMRPPPPLRTHDQHRWVVPAQRRASMMGPERFCFLNETHDLADIGWDSPGLSKLWRYNLHYFDDLNALGADSRTEWHHAVLLRWVHENSPTTGSGWESYPTSLRIVNWVKWSLRGNALPSECVGSLAIQGRWLYRRLERHLLGNHLFANAKALVFAGLFFRDAEASTWLERGMRIIAREIPEQVLADGGHFERSTMYHALMLEDVEDLCNIAAAYANEIPEEWKSLIAAWSELSCLMSGWLAAMSHPDGEISYFNDAAVGVAPTPGELRRYAERLGVSLPPVHSNDVTELDASGYVRVESGNAVAMLDVAPVGPNYLPAHAHADTLSFELSLYGRRVIVNSGTSEYGASAERLRQRGTRAHNTVVVDDHDSSEVWGGFRVARRARPLGCMVMRGEGVTVRCAHDGYRRLLDDVIHSRKWLFRADTLTIEDRISGSFRHAEARFHLHPSIQLDTTTADAGLILLLSQGKVVRVSVDGGELNVEKSTWHPEFGCSEPNLCLTVGFRSAVIRTCLQWEDSV